MNATIKKCTIADIESAPNLVALLEEYAAESAIGGLPHPNVKKEMYKDLEKAGALQTIAAYSGDTLVGFITVLAPIMPHYSVRVAVGESFFVAKEWRKTGSGLKLLRAAEGYAKESGAYGLLISTPFGGNLAQVMPHVGYSETNRVFFKAIAHE